MDDHSYSQDFIRKAETRIRRQLQDNGVDDPSKIKIQIKRHGEDVLKAETRFIVDCQVASTHQKGKSTQGRVIKAGELQSEIQSFKAGLQDRESITKQAKDLIKTLPLQGFGAENKMLELTAEKAILTENVTCSRCKGNGNMQCPKCKGMAKIKCPKCYGRGDLQCEVCLGHGKIQDGNGSKPCYKCHGNGEVFCYQCQGKKFIPCTHCHMKGQIGCSDCNGKGTNSVITSLTPFIELTSAIHVQDLETDPKRMAGKIGGLPLANGGHITIRTAASPEQEEIERAYFEEKPIDMSRTTVYYEADMPWAVGEIIINNKPHDITFAGAKGAVCESGSFMQQLIQPHLERLDRSTQKLENAQAAIKDACNLRVSRETFALLGKGKPKKVMQNIYKLYPLGWTKADIQTFVTIAYKSLKIATRRTRYAGLAVGLGITTLLNYLWFMTALKPEISLQSPLNILADGIPLIIGIIISMTAVKAIGFIKYYMLMSDIGVKSKNTPPMGKAGLYALACPVLIWVAFMMARYLGLY